MNWEKCTDEATYRSRYFPKASNSLQRQLNRLTPDLKALGVSVSKSVIHGSKKLVLEKVIKTSTPSTPDRVEPLLNQDCLGIDMGVDMGIDTLLGVDTLEGIDMGVDKKIEIDTQQMNAQQAIHPLGVDSVDKNTLFSKPFLENTKTIFALKVGDRVKPSNSFHERGLDLGTIESIDRDLYSVVWDSDRVVRRYTRDELEIAA